MNTRGISRLFPRCRISISSTSFTSLSFSYIFTFVVDSLLRSNQQVLDPCLDSLAILTIALHSRNFRMLHMVFQSSNNGKGAILDLFFLLLPCVHVLFLLPRVHVFFFLPSVSPQISSDASPCPDRSRPRVQSRSVPQ